MNLLIINIGDFETTALNSYCREVISACSPHFKRVHVFCRGENHVVDDGNIRFHCGTTWFWFRSLFQIRHEVSFVHAQDLFLGGLLGVVFSFILGTPLTVRCGGEWKYDINSMRALAKQLIAWFCKYLVGFKARRIVFNSFALKNKFRAFRNKSSVVHNGVNAKQFLPKKNYKNTAASVNLLFVGRVVVEKGVFELAEAVGKVDGCSLTVVGEGPALNELKDAFPFITTLGKVAHRDLPDLLVHYDALILPSHSEGFPNVVLEGMASGLPVLVSDLPGMRELISGDEGILFTPRSVTSIKEALRSLLNRNLEKMGIQARARVEQSFTLDRQRDLLYSALFKGRVVIFWDYELQQGIDASLSGISHTGYDEYDQTDKILDLHREYGFPAVFATVGTVAEEGDLPYHSRSQIERIVQDGHELASHSDRHEVICDLDEKQIRQTLLTSKRKLEEVGHCKVTTFVPPHNMPFELFGLSIYRRGRFRRCRLSVSGLCKVAGEMGYEVVRQYRMRPISRRLGWTTVKDLHYGEDCKQLYMSCGAGFEESARVAVQASVRRGGIAVISGHPQATLDQGSQSLESFRSFLEHLHLLRDQIDVVRVWDIQ